MSHQKLLIVFNYWSGDAARMMDAAQDIADLQPTFCEKADILFMSRFDCPHNYDVERKVALKFNVLSATCPRTDTGWPEGCNGLFYGTVDWLIEQKTSGTLPDYKAWLIFEADAFPLVTDWIEKLSEAWDKAGVFVLGSRQKLPSLHLNGNALYSLDLDFLKRITRKVVPPWPYDVVLHNNLRLVKPTWKVAATPLIRSTWRKATLKSDERQQFLKDGVVFLHGVQDTSVSDFLQLERS